MADLVKSQIPNAKSHEPAADRRFDLEERTFLFARDIALLCKKLPRTLSNIEYMKQLVRSSGSVGANYIEANESLGEKDFGMRIRISRKEAKESVYWLRLLKETNDSEVLHNIDTLINEATELKKILSSILNKTQSKH